MAPIEVEVSDHRFGWEIREKKVIQPSQAAEFQLDRFDVDSKLIVMCNEVDSGGEATVRKDFFAWTEDTEGNLLERINPEAKVSIERGSTKVINRRSVTRVEIKHVPSD